MDIITYPCWDLIKLNLVSKWGHCSMGLLLFRIQLPFLSSLKFQSFFSYIYIIKQKMYLQFLSISQLLDNAVCWYSTWWRKIVRLPCKICILTADYLTSQRAKSSWVMADFSWIILSVGLANGRWHYTVISSLIGWIRSQNDPCFTLGLSRANERRRYIVTSSDIGWAHSQNDPCFCTTFVLLIRCVHLISYIMSANTYHFRCGAGWSVTAEIVYLSNVHWYFDLLK